MNISNEEYGELTKRRSHNSKLCRTIPMAFLIGGLICITGFANAVASPALDFKSEGFVLGLGAKMFVIAGPVIVYGISASVVYGIIYYIVGLFTK